jgi:hypothetical protein
MMAFASLFLGNEWARLAGVAVICFGVGWVRGFDAVPKVDVPEVQRVAMESRDNEWKLRLAEESAVHETRIAAALEAAQAEPPVSAVPAERLRQCQSSTSCRDRKNSR